MKVLVFALVAMTCTLANAAPAPTVVAKQLQAVITDHKAASPAIAGEIMTVWTPNSKWSGAVGKVSGSQMPLTSQHSFRIASVTKSFTAAAILRLMETGRLDVTKPINDLISKETSALLIAGGYNPSQITVQQLMSHTSGIYDHAADAKFTAKVMSDPTYQWTRAEQIRHAMDNGKPLGKPGQFVSYSDTGYIILGEIIERKTRQNLASAVRSLLRFQKLGLTDTYWEQLERKPASSKAQFTGNMFQELDLTEANHSFDLFGGGGLISTTQDLNIFFRALLRGEVFDDRRTLAVLLTIPVAKQGEGEQNVYGNGVYPIQFGRHQCFGHGGFWGVVTLYCAASDTTVTWTMNYAGEVSEKVNILQRVATLTGN